MTESTSEYKKRIEEIKQSIENEPYMAKMREDIAEGISKTGIRQATVEEQFQDVQDHYEATVQEKFQNIDDQFHEVIENTTGKDVISAPEIIVGRGGYATLGERLDAVGIKMMSNSDFYWLPENQPSARTDHQNHFINGFVGNAEYYVNSLLEPLRANSDYVSRESLGKDASGVYDVWKYVFEPKNPLKTIVVTSVMHGGEVFPMICFSRFLHYLVNESLNHPQLNKFREQTRLVYVPFLNPWGASQTPRVRYNSNGVDINRNFPYKWSEYTSQTPAFGHDFKGTSAASEKETQIYMQLANEYQYAVAFLDLHNTGDPLRDFFYVVPENEKNDIYPQMTDYLSRLWDVENPDILVTQNSNPYACSWVNAEKGVSASHAEWTDTAITKSAKYSSAEVTYALTWFGNLVLQHTNQLKTNATFAQAEIKNDFVNTQFTNYDNWARTGMQNTVVSDGVLSAEGGATTYTPFFLGDLKTPNLKIGDSVFCEIVFKAPPNALKVELALRDTTTGLDQVFKTYDNPTSDSWLQISGVGILKEDTTNLKIRLRFFYASNSDVYLADFSIKEPICVVLNRDFGGYVPSEKYLTDNITFFPVTKNTTFVKNLDQMGKSDKDFANSLLAMLNKN